MGMKGLTVGHTATTQDFSLIHNIMTSLTLRVKKIYELLKSALNGHMSVLYEESTQINVYEIKYIRLTLL